MNCDIVNAANIFTIVYSVATCILVIVAIVAACYAKGNIGVLREQNRRNTFLNLMVDIAEAESREYRAILHKIYNEAQKEESYQPKEGKYPKRIADFFIGTGGGSHIWKDDVLEQGSLRNVWATVRDNIKLKDENDEDINRLFRTAFEETIALFDRVGFFLLNGDALLIEEAPLWIWDMTDGMWMYLGDYVEQRQKNNDGTEKNYAKYFKELAPIAKEKRNQL